MKIKTQIRLLALVLAFKTAVVFAFLDPSTGRWLNRDPAGDFGSLMYLSPTLTLDFDSSGDSTSDELLADWTQINVNLYGALGNSPLTSFDSFGLQCDSVSKAAENPDAAGQIARDYLKEVAEQQAARREALQAAEKTLKDVGDKVKNIKQALDKDHLNAARQELQGNPVKFKPDGTAYDHVQEVRNAQRGLANQIDKLKNSLGGTPSDSAESLQLQKQISDLSKLLDYTKGYCPMQ